MATCFKSSLLKFSVVLNLATSPIILLPIIVLVLGFLIGIVPFIAFSFSIYTMVVAQYYGSSIEYGGNDRTKGLEFVFNNLEDLLFKFSSVVFLSLICRYRGYNIEISNLEIEAAAISVIFAMKIPNSIAYVRYKALYIQSMLSAISAYILYSVFWYALRLDSFS